VYEEGCAPFKTPQSALLLRPHKAHTIFLRDTCKETVQGYLNIRGLSRQLTMACEQHRTEEAALLPFLTPISIYQGL